MYRRFGDGGVTECGAVGTGESSSFEGREVCLLALRVHAVFAFM